MKTVNEYVTDTSAQLNDQQAGREFTRWTRALLVSYLNEALAEIGSHKPEAFAKQVDITLQAGRTQKLDETQPTLTGARIVSVDKNSDGSGLYEADHDLLMAYAPFACCTPEVEVDSFGRVKYRAVSFSINPRDTRTFLVSPPVPAGLSPVVGATIYGRPPRYAAETDLGDIVDIESKYQASIMDYMLGRGFEVDNESPASRANADKHMGRFYTMLGIKYRYESANRAGNFNGAVGDGDPRARIQ